MTRGLSTLSSNSVGPGDVVKGLLYVPDLDRNDPCINSTRPYIPSNATRQANLPLQDYHLIALAPWVSSECTQSFLASADGDPIQGFLFFLPNRGNQTPPMVSDPAWNLGDGGSWKSQHEYSVYAISTTVATALMKEISLYSGNMTDVPYGHNLTEIYSDSRDYVRIFAQIPTGLSELHDQAEFQLIEYYRRLCCNPSRTMVVSPHRSCSFDCHHCGHIFSDASFTSKTPCSLDEKGSQR
jgi:hypothetical protein